MNSYEQAILNEKRKWDERKEQAKFEKELKKNGRQKDLEEMTHNYCHVSKWSKGIEQHRNGTFYTVWGTQTRDMNIKKMKRIAWEFAEEQAKITGERQKKIYKLLCREIKEQQRTVEDVARKQRIEEYNKYVLSEEDVKNELAIIKKEQEELEANGATE